MALFSDKRASKQQTNTPNSDSTTCTRLETPHPPSSATSSTSTLPVEAPQTTTFADSKPALTKIITGSKPSSTHSKDKHVHEDVDHTAEFAGEVNTNNDLPTAEIVKKIGDFTVLDRDGKSVPFRNVYSGPNVVRRVLVVFIRHFFCGNCQEYVRALAAHHSFTPQDLLSQSPPTFVCVIGCGSPSLIPMYASQTDCPYPIYTDPTKQLYTALNMIRTFNFGSTQPGYMKKTMFGLAVKSVVQGVKELGKGNVFKNGEWGGGDMGQVGGEFLFESKNADYSPGGISPGEEVTPNANYTSEVGKGGDYLQAGKAAGRGEDEKVVTWCHRMKHTRDHAEISTLMKVLGVDEEEERKKKEFGERKLTGMSARSKASSLAEDFERGVRVGA